MIAPQNSIDSNAPFEQNDGRHETLIRPLSYIRIKMKVVFAFLLICVLFASGCGLNDNPPAYIEKIGIYDIDHDGTFEFYFALCDSSGEMTTSDGSVRFLISEPDPGFDVYPDGSIVEFVGTHSLYWSGGEVKKTDFHRTRIKGHESVVSGLGAAMIHEPRGDKAEITLEFTTPNGTVLSKRDTLIVQNKSFYIKGDEQH